MWIQYLTGIRRNVADKIGQVLIDRGIARLYETRQMTVEPAVPSGDVEISPRTGKPRRAYKRRDMTAGD